MASALASRMNSARKALSIVITLDWRSAVPTWNNRRMRIHVPTLSQASRGTMPLRRSGCMPRARSGAVREALRTSVNQLSFGVGVLTAARGPFS
jgi:hypothetical protein